uniref:Uncharacterized protein n=1 Tax=Globisporangium ultimum (strain ATCC 200006 / CBS 805.95 / DAOM BR144) TaxID=431595 RepID=K3W501_GLOUD
MASPRVALRGVLLLLLSIVVCLQQVCGVAVQFNDALARSYAARDGGLSFLALDDEPLPASILLPSVDSVSGDPKARIECCETEADVRDNAEPVTVLLAISKCVNASSLQMIEEWVTKIKDEQLSYFQDGAHYNITFSTTLVPGACEARSERHAHGRYEDDDKRQSPQYFLADEVTSRDLDRIATFARFGRVLDALPADNNRLNTTGVKHDIPIAVVGFVNNDKSFGEVERFERLFQIRHAFNFQLCESGVNCAAHKFENCIFLHESVDLFLYNPFTVTHTLECDRVLAHGIPVSYVDPSGARQCFCSCPAGYEQQDAPAFFGDDKKACVKKDDDEHHPTCAWSAHPLGFKHCVTTREPKCAFSKIASEWGIPVPFPTDNYVSDERTNTRDRNSEYSQKKKQAALMKGPHVRVTATDVDVDQALDGDKIHQLSLMGDVGLFDTKVPPPGIVELLDLLAVGDIRRYIKVPHDRHGENSAGYHSEKAYTWRNYQTNRRAAIDTLTFPGYGTYALELYAQDYSQNATCRGCLAIVDKFRPKATTVCPVSMSSKSTYLTALAKHHTEGLVAMTTVNLKKTHNRVLDFFKFGDEAENDACSERHRHHHSHDAMRCDATLLTQKSFFEHKYSSIDATHLKRYFKPEHVASDLVAALKHKGNPLVQHKKEDCAEQTITPVKDGQCMRCAKLLTALKEYWTDYTCGYEYNLRRCDGDANQTCAFEQCLVLSGGSLARAKAFLKPHVVRHSKQFGYEASSTEIHHELGCTQIGGHDGKCEFKTTLSKLIETATRPGAHFHLNEDVAGFVFWRYKINRSGKWKLWKHGHGEHRDGHETFSQAETDIHIEAWTQCGITYTTMFTVVLHPRPSYPSYGGYMTALMSTGVAFASASSEHAGMVALLATSALVALFALVVVVIAVRARSPASEVDTIMLMSSEEVDEGVYHSLLI